MSDRHISKTKPEIVRQYGRYMWLDPTSEAARKYSVDVISDVVRRYDIDGIHFDDYFYPYVEKDAAGNDIDFPDEASWKARAKEDKNLSRADWRRKNVNLFIYRLYRGAGLAVRKRRKRERVAVERRPLQVPSGPNHTWSMDFMFDALANGRPIKCLTVVDDCTKEAVEIAVGRRINGQNVADILDAACRFRGYPAAIRTDQGP